MHIAVIGTGYVGLVSGASFAAMAAGGDRHVTCVDIDGEKIARLQRGIAPIHEPGLDALLARGLESGNLSFTTDHRRAVAASDVVIIAVGTPGNEGDDHADLGAVDAAAESIATAIDGYSVIVNKSTVPVGTARRVSDIVARRRPEAAFDVVSNPEFLREGAALEDFNRPRRIVIGADSARAAGVMRTLYQPLADRGAVMIVTDSATAEVIKYAANGFLATKVAFINEMADFCERAGANVTEVAHAMGLDPRIGPDFLQPGPGYGGSCFPKDTRELAATGRALGVPLRIMESVVAANAARKSALADRLRSAVGGSLRGRRVGVLGLAFKAGTDDLRESPALDLVRDVCDAGARVTAHDPQAMGGIAALQPDLKCAAEIDDVLRDAEVLAIMTEWPDYAELDPARIKALMATAVVVDFRNLYAPAEMARAGVRYLSLGREAGAAPDTDGNNGGNGNNSGNRSGE